MTYWQTKAIVAMLCEFVESGRQNVKRADGSVTAVPTTESQENAVLLLISLHKIAEQNEWERLCDDIASTGIDLHA